MTAVDLIEIDYFLTSSVAEFFVSDCSFIGLVGKI